MSSVSSCVSVVQPEKIYQVFVHDSVVLLEKSVCSYVQLYSPKKYIATLIRALFDLMFSCTA